MSSNYPGRPKSQRSLELVSNRRPSPEGSAQQVTLTERPNLRLIDCEPYHEETTSVSVLLTDISPQVEMIVSAAKTAGADEESTVALENIAELKVEIDTSGWKYGMPKIVERNDASGQHPPLLIEPLKFKSFSALALRIATAGVIAEAISKGNGLPTLGIIDQALRSGTNSVACANYLINRQLDANKYHPKAVAKAQLAAFIGGLKLVFDDPKAKAFGLDGEDASSVFLQKLSDTDMPHIETVDLENFVFTSGEVRYPDLRLGKCLRNVFESDVSVISVLEPNGHQIRVVHGDFRQDQ